MGTRPAHVPVLIPVADAGVAGLFPAGGAGRMEASGVLTLDDEFLVVFDDSRNIGVIGSDLANTATNRMIIPSGAPVDQDWEGYEDIARDPVTGSFYLLVEAAERGDGSWMAKVEVCDKDFRRLSDDWLPFTVPDSGKGMEGLTCVRRGDRLFLLALCEGNNCQGGGPGKQPGGGRIQVFEQHDDGPIHGWRHVGPVELPEYLWFTDHAGLSVRGDRIAVLSQESAAIWIGRFDPSTWQITDAGSVYEFPRDNKDRPRYCLVEGVAWIGENRLVACSDRAKSGTPGRCREKQQSLHIFDIPQ